MSEQKSDHVAEAVTATEPERNGGPLLWLLAATVVVVGAAVVGYAAIQAFESFAQSLAQL